MKSSREKRLELISPRFERTTSHREIRPFSIPNKGMEKVSNVITIGWRDIVSFENGKWGANEIGGENLRWPCNAICPSFAR